MCRSILVAGAEQQVHAQGTHFSFREELWQSLDRERARPHRNRSVRTTRTVEFIPSIKTQKGIAEKRHTGRRWSDESVCGRAVAVRYSFAGCWRRKFGRASSAEKSQSRRMNRSADLWFAHYLLDFRYIFFVRVANFSSLLFFHFQCIKTAQFLCSLHLLRLYCLPVH